MKKVIISNNDFKTLWIMPSDTELLKSEEIVGPYLAMYNLKYRGFVFANWENKENPSLKNIREIVGNPKWEEYVFSIIVEEGTTFEEMNEIVEELGYIPDYFLQKTSGELNVLHQTDHFDSLIKNGYMLTDYKDGYGNYSFGRGLYCLDKDLFEENATWPKQSNVYLGHYDGEYLRCVEDTQNGLKCGTDKIFQQEIVIPFNEKEIKWELK